jgi:putative two-component system response regulator
MMPQQTFRILTIDDNEAIHDDYRKVLCATSKDLQLAEAAEFLFGETEEPHPLNCNLPIYQIDSALQGLQGIELVKQSMVQNCQYACAFIDVRMPPGIDGVETSKRIWEIDPDLPIVLCTAYSDRSWEDISYQLNQTDKLLILKKPFDPLELRQVAAAQTAHWQLSKTIEQNTQLLETRVLQRTNEILETRDLVFFTLARLAESRDPETGHHLERIEGYTRLLTQWLATNGPYQNQLTEHYCDEICRSSILHDIGKVGIPDSILLKPGRLTHDEFEIMKQHAEIGAEALEDSALHSESSNFLSLAIEIARFHHEKYNGEGYPHGLSGTDIPLSARIVTVADVFDALTSERVYKKAMPAEEARMLILSESGQHFDPEIVAAFVAQWEAFKQCADREHEAPTIPLVGQLLAQIQPSLSPPTA